MNGKKVEYYHSCPNCSAPRQENWVICPYCGTSFIKSVHTDREKAEAMERNSSQQDSSLRLKSKMPFVLILVSFIILAVIPLAGTIYYIAFSSSGKSSLPQKTSSPVQGLVQGQEVSGEVSGSDSAELIKEDLLRLGFPADILEDLTEEDILSCKNPFRVFVQKDNLPYKGVTLADVYCLRDPKYSLDQRVVQDIPKLHQTTVAVKVNRDSEDKENSWILIHHFSWERDVTFYGTEAIHMNPAFTGLYTYQNHKVTGRLLYDEKEEVRSLEFNSIYEIMSGGKELNHKDTDFSDMKKYFTEEYDGNIYAEFDFPETCTRPRGYIAYGVRLDSKRYWLETDTFYIHQRKDMEASIGNALQVWFDGSEMADPNTLAEDHFVAEENIFEIQ